MIWLTVARLLSPASWLGIPFDSLVGEIDDAAAAAWTAPERQYLDGWELRWSRGSTNRTNSVRPREHVGATSISQKLMDVREFYARRGRPTMYQISPATQPPGLDDILDRAEYRIHNPSVVQIASVGDILGILPPQRKGSISQSHTLTDEWYDRWRLASESTLSTRIEDLEILRLVQRKSVFLQLEMNHEIVAVGRGVVDGRLLGVFSMATMASVRGRGAGREILRALAEWGRDSGAEAAYLQVDADNSPALHLYARCGFRKLYEYWYRLSDQ